MEGTQDLFFENEIKETPAKAKTKEKQAPAVNTETGEILGEAASETPAPGKEEKTESAPAPGTGTKAEEKGAEVEPTAPAQEEPKAETPAQEEQTPAAAAKKTRKAPKKKADEGEPSGAGTEESADAGGKTSEPETLPQDIHGQLMYIQQHLKVGKPNLNEFNGPRDSFAYRTLEDVYVELKPILAKLGCVLTMPFIPQVFGNTVFATATARLQNARGESIEVTSSAAINLSGNTNKFPAQEALSSGTMARKSALSGLFLLDDTTKEQQQALTPSDMDGEPQPGSPAAKAGKGAGAHVSIPAPAPAVGESRALGPESTASLAGPSLPELKKDSTDWHRLGVKTASQFSGTKEQLIASLRRHYEVSDKLAEEFANAFYKAPEA